MSCEIVLLFNRAVYNENNITKITLFKRDFMRFESLNPVYS